MSDCGHGYMQLDPEAASLPWKESGVHGRLQCFFESLGSPSGCRHEDYLLQHGTGAFQGLHSNWIHGDILACARPSEKMLDEGLAERFSESGINAILNLQEKGEHPWCGPGIIHSGFSYDPQRFTDAGVAFHHLPWQDMGCPSLDTMLAIVVVMKDAINSGGKVAIHCHAGLGRTGLVAACYLVHSGGMSATEAINLVRAQRPGSIQTPRQAEYIKSFQEYVFPSGTSDVAPLLAGTTSGPEEASWSSRVMVFWHTLTWALFESIHYLLTCCTQRRHTEPLRPSVQATTA